MTLQLYRLDGHKPVKCTVLEWAEMFETQDKRVADDMVGKVRISTIFLGINHNFGISGKPILFETMGFDESGDTLFCDRYTDWDSAVLGHQNKIKEYEIEVK